MPTHKESSRAEYNYCYKSVSFRKLRLRSANCGAILIEFAVCMPILIILLFYINDLMRLKRIYSQTEFVAQQMANILQNISQKRESSNRKITKSDIGYAASLAYLSMFPGTTRFMLSGQSSHVSDLGYNPLGYIFYVKGNSDSTASVVWSRRFHLADGVFNPSGVSIDTNRLDRSNVKALTNASPSDIYPTLKINPNEIKIIIECAIHYSRSSGYHFTDGRTTSNVTASQAFGLRFFNLSPTATRAGSNDAIFFNSVAIFTPNPGLFNTTAPA